MKHKRASFPRYILAVFMLSTLFSAGCSSKQPAATHISETGTPYVQIVPTEINSITPTSGSGGVLSYPPAAPGARVLIPAGDFQMGCASEHGESDCYEREFPLHTVYLDAFLIDATEVTNDQYIQCVTAGACTAPSSSSSSEPSPTYSLPEYADFPVTYVDWYQAQAYCSWTGGSLPTEAQWEKVARGNADVRTFPWGAESPDCRMASFASPSDGCELGLKAAGSYPSGASPYGVLDMAGNVAEWVYDWFAESYYGISPHSNPTGPETGTDKVLRGGSFLSMAFQLSVSNRITGNPTVTFGDWGFRCAYAP